MSFLHRLTARPLVPLCSALIAILGILAGVLYWHHSLRNQEVYLAHFGQALASHAARQAVNPTLNQDLISLQVILQELTRHPHIAGATIHDVEQQLLVQSGFSVDDSVSHSAPIALHNNVAGYLRITTAPPSLSSQDWRFFGLWSLLVLLAMTVPWMPDTLSRWRRAAPDAPAAPESALAETPPGDPVTVRLVLEIRNLPLLHQQLNLDSFSQVVTYFEEQLQGVLTLYGGRRSALAQHWLLLDFEGYDRSDCAVRALCSAWLLAELTRTNPGPKLRLRAHAFSLSDQPTSLLEELSEQLGDGNPTMDGISLAGELLDEAVQEHLHLDPDSGRLLDIQPSYKDLLQKQQKQLQQFTVADNA